MVANGIQAIGQLISPPSAVRAVAGSARTARSALARILQWRPGRRGRVSVPPVSAKWLVEHESLSAKRQER